MVKISRRDFLKGSGATALSLMAAGLVGWFDRKRKNPGGHYTGPFCRK